MANHRQRPPARTGIARIWAAFFYSFAGLRSALDEPAFRQEVCLVAPALAVLPFMPFPLAWKGMLFLSTVAVPVVELLNSAIESVVDISSPEYHDLARRAKDFGSAAVLLSILQALVLWVAALFSFF